jgi:hypothetical protein
MILWLATTWTGLDLLVVLVALCAATVCWRKQNLQDAFDRSLSATGILIAASLCLGFDIVFPRLAIIDSAAASNVHLGATLALIIVWIALRRGAFRAAAAIAIVFAVFSGARFIDSVAQPGIDVWRAHEGAANLLVAGSNPYQELDLTLEPDSTEGRLRQYFYPSLTLSWYSLWTISLGDPRWGSLIAWLALLTLGAVSAVRGRDPSAGVALVTFAAVQPGWFMLLAGSFTEVFAVMLIAVSMALARRNPTLAAIVLGLGISSKQHLILAVPLVLVVLWPHRRREAILTVIAAGASFLSGLVFGVSTYLRAVLFGPTLALFDPEGVSLYAAFGRLGFDIPTPQWFAIPAALVATVWLARRASFIGWPADGVAGVMAGFLALVPFAIWSHWMMVTLLLTVAVVARVNAPHGALVFPGNAAGVGSSSKPLLGR